MKAYLSLPGLFAKHSRAKSMFARCQLPINQPLAAVLLPASLPEGEGRTDSKGFVCSVVVWQRLWTAGGLQMSTAWSGAEEDGLGLQSSLKAKSVSIFFPAFVKLPGSEGGDSQRCLWLQCGYVESWALHCLRPYK